MSDNNEPIAWAIVGRATGRVRRVTTDDEEAREQAEHYDVWPLFRQGPITDEWEYRVIGDYIVYPSLARLRRDFRRPNVAFERRAKAGPWEPVEAARGA